MSVKPEETLEQTGSKICAHYVVMIRELRHANLNKQDKLLDDFYVALPRGVV